MRRIISWLIMGPAGIAVVVFALHNKGAVALDLWPFGMTVEMPLYLAMTGILAVGVFLGGVVSWAAGGSVRAELREQTYAAEVSRRKLATEEEKSAKLERELRQMEIAHRTDPTQALAPPQQETLAPERAAS
ncbi:MAG: LapA family protein [Alphaproteobacteria bacterium]|nr:LapA family protein [Alphaproteobacteria bacterium]MBF0250625.1 LapA family protein [Alphaproteobacteria bacterium]